MMLSVIVPTYRRGTAFARCLDALDAQVRRAEEILLVRRREDEEAAAIIQEWLTTRPFATELVVDAPGVVAALNVGLGKASGDIVAFTDDDAAPLPDWLFRIEQHFKSDPRVGGVGGRDYVYGRKPGDRWIVGTVQWWGRCVGDHDRGKGDPRYVDILRGANMSFRREALEGRTFDTRLRGDGAQVSNELKLSLEVRSAGWLIVYDPNVAVDHVRAERLGEDQRTVRTWQAQCDAAHNETLALLEFLPPLRRLIFVGWALAVGTKEFPGFLQLARPARTGGQGTWTMIIATVAGRFAGIRSWWMSR